VKARKVRTARALDDDEAAPRARTTEDLTRLKESYEHIDAAFRAVREDLAGDEVALALVAQWEEGEVKPGDVASALGVPRAEVYDANDRVRRRVAHAFEERGLDAESLRRRVEDEDVKAVREMSDDEVAKELREAAADAEQLERTAREVRRHVGKVETRRRFRLPTGPGQSKGCLILGLIFALGLWTCGKYMSYVNDQARRARATQGAH
jgi:hypothetical protein